MSIGTGVVVAVALQQVDGSPNTKTGTQCDNESLNENMLRIVCAHELGHDQLHRNMAKTTPIHEFMLYDMKSKPEYEANIVAAEILMDSDEVL